MNAADVTFALDEALPDSKITSDLRAVLEEGSVDGFVSIELEIELETGGYGMGEYRTEPTLVPIDAPIEILVKRFSNEHLRGASYKHYVVRVAIGEFQQDENGFHQAGYCFAELYYGEDGVLVTEDYRRQYVHL